MGLEKVVAIQKMQIENFRLMVQNLEGIIKLDESTIKRLQDEIDSIQKKQA